jgi:hypothetical protein
VPQTRCLPRKPQFEPDTLNIRELTKEWNHNQQELAELHDLFAKWFVGSPTGDEKDARDREMQRLVKLDAIGKRINSLLEAEKKLEINKKWRGSFLHPKLTTHKFYRWSKRRSLPRLSTHMPPLEVKENGEIIRTLYSDEDKIQGLHEEWFGAGDACTNPDCGICTASDQHTDAAHPQYSPPHLRKGDLESVLGHMSRRGPRTPGPDGIPLELLMICRDQLDPYLMEASNASMKFLRFPAIHKLGRIIALPKSLGPGDSLSDLSKWRPITLLSIIGKTLERILSDRLTELGAKTLPPTQMALRVDPALRPFTCF